MPSSLAASRKGRLYTKRELGELMHVFTSFWGMGSNDEGDEACENAVDWMTGEDSLEACRTLPHMLLLLLLAMRNEEVGTFLMAAEEEEEGDGCCCGCGCLSFFEGKDARLLAFSFRRWGKRSAKCLSFAKAMNMDSHPWMMDGRSCISYPWTRLESAYPLRSSNACFVVVVASSRFFKD